jgi:hypothetical protein
LEEENRWNMKEESAKILKRGEGLVSRGWPIEEKIIEVEERLSNCIRYY